MDNVLETNWQRLINKIDIRVFIDRSRIAFIYLND